MPSVPETEGINTFGESSLHAELKQWYAQPGDRLEAPVDGHIIDLVRDPLLIEIQTGNFSNLKKKLLTLLPNHRVHIVYPLPETRWITKLDGSGSRQISRRRSPKRGHILHIFGHLLYIHEYLLHPNFSLEVLMIEDEDLRIDDGKGSWRRRGVSIMDRRLLSVNDSIVFRHKSDYLSVLPEGLPEEFTTAELSKAAAQTKAIAQKTAYTLKKMNIITMTGKRGNAYLYKCSQQDT